MRKFTKILILTAIEIVVMLAFLNFSDVSRLASTVFFPPIFAITIYLFIIFLLEADRKLTYNDFIIALILASIALLSSAAGFHLASNEISEQLQPFFQENGEITPSLSKALVNDLYFLDEKFSHWIMTVAAVGLIISGISWWYLRVYKPRVSGDTPVFVEEKKEREIWDLFMLLFIGTFIGALMAFASIEAQILPIGVAIFGLITPLAVFKLRNYKPTLEGKDRILSYVSFVTSYLAVGIAYIILTKTNLLIHY